MARRSSFWIVALMHVAALPVWADAGGQQPLEIYVYNHAGVPVRVLAQAEEKATRIFYLSGLQTIWINCLTDGIAGTNCTGLPQPGNVIVQIVHETRTLKDEVFGAAFLGEDGAGQYSDVYYDRVTDLHREWNISLVGVLGHVIAHEIGHLLLGLNSHSTSGIMRGLWEEEELKAVERGRLLFTSQQSRLMRQKLIAIAGERNLKTASKLASTSPGS